MTPRPSCPGCSAEQADWLLCKKCAQRLTNDLAAIPGLMAQLEITLTRQSKMSAEGGRSGKGKERPLPYNEHARKAKDYIKNQLTTWVRELDLGDTVGLADNPRALAHWLIARIERIRGHAASNELCDEMAYCVQIARQAIDRPADKVLMGSCGELVEGEICGVTMYARSSSVSYECKCGTMYDVAARRAEMLALVEHQWAKVGVCSSVLANFGIAVKVDTIQNWARRGSLAARGTDSAGAAIYRIGDVIDLASKAMERKSDKRSGDTPDVA